MYLSYHFDQLNISVNKMSFNLISRFKLYRSIIYDSLKTLSQSIFLGNTHCVYLPVDASFMRRYVSE